MVFFDFFVGLMDNIVRLWDVVKVFEDLEIDDFIIVIGYINLFENL